MTEQTAPSPGAPAPSGGPGPFWFVLGFLAAFYLALRLVFPLFAGWIASEGWFSVRGGLETTGYEVYLYFPLAVVGAAAWVSYQEERWLRFQEPVWRLLRTPGPRRAVVLLGLPVLVGGSVFLSKAGGVEEPQPNPIRHPTPPTSFGSLRNPYREPTDEMLLAFETSVRESKLAGDGTTEEEVRRYIAAVGPAVGAAVGKGSASPELRREAFRRRAIEEGRILFQINCRPCHGTKARGDGPLARGLRREPADFTGVETIATLVEGAVFWRIKKGGIGLPREGAPWESAMPSWEEDLTDEQIWKIIMAEYDIAGNAPREPERLE